MHDKKRSSTKEPPFKQTLNRGPLKPVRHRPHRKRQGVRCNRQTSKRRTHMVAEPRTRTDMAATSDCFNQGSLTPLCFRISQILAGRASTFGTRCVTGTAQSPIRSERAIPEAACHRMRFIVIRPRHSAKCFKRLTVTVGLCFGSPIVRRMISAPSSIIIAVANRVCCSRA